MTLVAILLNCHSEKRRRDESVIHFRFAATALAVFSLAPG
jgi:hypothetical protein